MSYLKKIAHSNFYRVHVHWNALHLVEAQHLEKALHLVECRCSTSCRSSTSLVEALHGLVRPWRGLTLMNFQPDLKYYAK